MMPTVQYAINAICDGAESTVEDDLNEDGKLSDRDHEVACGMAMAMINVIRAYPEEFFEWTATRLTKTPA